MLSRSKADLAYVLRTEGWVSHPSHVFPLLMVSSSNEAIMWSSLHPRRAKVDTNMTPLLASLYSDRDRDTTCRSGLCCSSSISKEHAQPAATEQAYAVL